MAPMSLHHPASGARAGWLLAGLLLAGGASLASNGASALATPSATSSAPLSLVGAVDAATTEAAPKAIAQVLEPVLTEQAPLAPAPDGIVQPATPAVAAPATTTSASATTTTTTSGVWWSTYKGRNHVWMPTLGINRTVYLFPCDRGTSPDNLVYRWGCAGRNNVYLLGHAYGVFAPLHDAYDNGKLKVGMPVIYADALGHVHLFRVTKWQVVSPIDISWSYAQPTSSMTLQTCVGTGGTKRLNVRLVEVRT